MQELIPKLEEWAAKDSRVRAELRRSLSFDPGNYPPAYPYVEWSLTDQDNSWKRTVFYLVAGLWAQHWRKERIGTVLPIGRACAQHQQQSGSASAERRFIALLDSDQEQLPHRLRQMFALLKDYPLDFRALLKDLLYWDDDRKRTQNAWARDFYRTTIENNEANLAEETAP
jgi:CRISPR system Cascade subunit CasB